MSNYTQLGFIKQTDGENEGAWGDALNENLIDLLDDAIGGYVEVSVASGNVTLAFADGTADNNGRHAVIKFTGSPGTTRTVTFPNKQKTYYINNGSDGSVICTAGSGGATVTVLTGNKDIIYVDGSDEIHSVLTRTSVVLGTNTSGNILVADGNQFNSIAATDLSAISSIASGDTLLAVDASGGGLKKVARSVLVAGLATSSALNNVSEDSTPQLGGDLDVNSNGLISTSNANIAITPNGTGVVRLDGNVDIQSGLIDLKNSGAVSKIKFYCESSNAHAQTLQGAPHSQSASNSLTLPSTGGDVDLVSTASTATLTNKTLTSPKINEDVAVTSTATELNLLDGVTATTAELNILDGVTSTAAELNLLDGVSGLVQADLTKLAAVDSTAAELNIVDGNTSATGTTLADADRLVTNDNGTMVQVALSDVKTYLSSAGFSTDDPTALAIALG